MNVLVTGNEGFVGSRLASRLKEEGNFVVGLARNREIKNRPSGESDLTIRGDIRDKDLVRRIIADYEIEEVYHMAAQSIVRTCSRDPQTAFDINIMGLVSVLEGVRNSGQTVKSIVVSSSDKAFGHSAPPYTEETPLDPKFVYETSKACQQLVSMSYFQNFGTPVKVVASSNIYGPGDFNMTRIIPNTIVRLAKGQRAQLNEGASQFVREFVYVDDAVDAFMTTSREGSEGEVYCCGGTEHLSVKSLLENICLIMNKDPARDIETFRRDSTFKEIETQYIDSSKLRSIGWFPRVPLEEGLRKTVDWYQNYLTAGGNNDYKQSE